MKKNVTTLVLLSFLPIFIFSSLFAQVPDSWTKKGDFGGTERYGAVGFSIGTKGYLGTGWTTARVNDFWEYDPSTDTWTQKADFGGIPRVFASGFSIGTKGYIGCGNLVGSLAKDFWEYDPAANSWSKKADFAGAERKGAVGLSIGGKGYLGTGLTDDSTTFVNDFWEYDPASDSWTQKTNVGGPVRAYSTGFSLGSKGYIGTGHTGVTLIKDLWEYDPATDTWTQKTNFGGETRYGAVGLSIGAYGYIGSGDNGIAYTNDIWEYDPGSDSWKRVADFGGIGRTAASGFSIGYRGYIGTGTDLVVKTNDFWEYTPLCTTPTLSSQPVNQSITYGDAAQFTVVAVNAVSYQWQEDSGSGFTDITDGGIYSDATFSTLTISMPTVAMSGFKYRCVMTGTCGLTASTDGNATLTVAPIPIVITPDAGQTKVYGSADPTLFTYTFAPALVGTDVISGLMDRLAGENAGEYTFTPGSLTAGTNYSLTVAALPTFSITPVALTITAEDKEKCYDGAIYSGTYTVTYNGFVNTEDEGVLGGTLVFGGTSATGILAGNYSIDPSGLTSGNYAIVYVNGTLNIKATPGAAIITRSGDSLISNVTSGNQWYLDGVEITGSTGDIYVATSNGTYYSVITENGCSSAPSNSIAVLDVSIREVSSEIFDIYPNPSNGVFNIKLKTTGKSLYNIEIYNSLGALVWKQNNAMVDGNNIKLVDLKGPKSGLYTVVLKNKANSFAKKVYIAK